MSILIKGIPLGGYEISIMKDGERYRARVDGIWCEVEEIPTTEPDTDTISRAKAIDALRKMQTYKLFSGDDMLLIDQAGAQTELMLLPPAQPEIIRCKDCKHWIPYDWMFSEVWRSKNIADYPEDEMGCDCCDMAMKANDFCSRGERKNDG